MYSQQAMDLVLSANNRQDAKDTALGNAILSQPLEILAAAFEACKSMPND